jgi:hypothetical protein
MSPLKNTDGKTNRKRNKLPSPLPPGALGQKKNTEEESRIILTWAISISVKSISAAIVISSNRISCEKRRPSHRRQTGKQAGKILVVSVHTMAYIHEYNYFI